MPITNVVSNFDDSFIPCSSPNMGRQSSMASLSSNDENLPLTRSAFSLSTSPSLIKDSITPVVRSDSEDCVSGGL